MNIIKLLLLILLIRSIDCKDHELILIELIYHINNKSELNQVDNKLNNIEELEGALAKLMLKIYNQNTDLVYTVKQLNKFSSLEYDGYQIYEIDIDFNVFKKYYPEITDSISIKFDSIINSKSTTYSKNNLKFYKNRFERDSIGYFQILNQPNQSRGGISEASKTIVAVKWINNKISDFIMLSDNQFISDYYDKYYYKDQILQYLKLRYYFKSDDIQQVRDNEFIINLLDGSKLKFIANEEPTIIELK